VLRVAACSSVQLAENLFIHIYHALKHPGCAGCRFSCGPLPALILSTRVTIIRRKRWHARIPQKKIPRRIETDQINNDKPEQET
jgi:hypothetical protein